MKPIEPDADALMVGTNVIGTYLPEWEDIPEIFKKDDHAFSAYPESLFFNGARGLKFIAKDGIDLSCALKHIVACLRSFEPQYEHKMAGVAYLMSEFFEDIEVL